MLSSHMYQLTEGRPMQMQVKSALTTPANSSSAQHTSPRLVLVKRMQHGSVVPHLGRSEVAQFELLRGCVNQQVLGLDVPVAHPHAVYMRQRSAHLCHACTHPHTASADLQARVWSLPAALLLHPWLSYCGQVKLKQGLQQTEKNLSNASLAAASAA